MLGNLVPDDPLSANMVYHNEGAHIFMLFIRFFLRKSKNGQCLFNGPAARWRMERPGTVVYLRDVFHNVC